MYKTYKTAYSMKLHMRDIQELVNEVADDLAVIASEEREEDLTENPYDYVSPMCAYEMGVEPTLIV